MTPDDVVGKIGLGTAQWGLPYGIANRTGRPPVSEIARILSRARDAGIALLDTAAAYGEAETVIGQLAPETRDFEIVTKTLPFLDGSGGPKRPGEVDKGVRRSLSRLARTTVRVLLVHHAHELLAPHGEALWACLRELKAAGQAEQLGVSAYEPEELERVLERFSIDVVQLPFNLYDQRFARRGLLRELSKGGIEVHVRSAFLQGVLLMAPNELPEHLASIRKHHRRWRDALSADGISPLAGALGFCLRQAGVTRVIVGCEHCEQLEDIIIACNELPAGLPDSAAFGIDDDAVTDPRRWPAAHT